MGGNWANERSRGATRHPEKEKGTREQVSVFLLRVGNWSTSTHREGGMRE